MANIRLKRIGFNHLTLTPTRGASINHIQVETHQGHYITADGTHYRLADGSYYVVK